MRPHWRKAAGTHCAATGPMGAAQRHRDRDPRILRIIAHASNKSPPADRRRRCALPRPAIDTRIQAPANHRQRMRHHGLRHLRRRPSAPRIEVLLQRRRCIHLDTMVRAVRYYTDRGDGLRHTGHRQQRRRNKTYSGGRKDRISDPASRPYPHGRQACTAIPGW
ncbi:hypothetical protein GALL_546970 [mine drainage metagenome]|uniref:Uncharacterized protein n=1 Tax=mine drainage metagenome TaxID=410659 RepID=A0A1J5NX02_9ZZZZ